eukprot:TRINITY_DN9045_c0_g1_i1.p1 TRINITY_DN9045_c0_g1~~TRINITY_DN9045_c0_g1_i1.p1  ORF type:complete len:476 (+),score=165.74 TRINITY_DN9045_c0_g1_i1:80-1507(+)
MCIRDRLLCEVHNNYVKLRQELVLCLARPHVAKVCGTEALPAALRECSVYLARISADEFELVGALFVTSGAWSVLAVFLRLLEGLWEVLHDAVRPIIIAEVHLDALCRVLEVLTLEIPELLEQMHPTVSSMLQPVLARLGQDAQERLIYRAQAFMVAKIGSFYPSPAHLQYPALLQSQDVKDGWYPTLRYTLDLLAKVWRCLRKEIFEGLAQEATSLCIASFEGASKTVARQASAFDGDLFLIKHLHTLREQTLPFAALDYAVSDVALDFGSIQHGLAKLFSARGSSSIFSWSGSNPLLSTLRRKHTSHNPKQQLEQALSQACERFILSVAQRVGAALIALSASINQSKPLQQAQVDTVAAEADEQLNSVLMPLVAKMRQYCEGSGSLLGMLIEPIEASMQQVVHRLHEELHPGQGQELPLCACLQQHLALVQAILHPRSPQEPTESPTGVPSEAPTEAPTEAPAESPTEDPTEQ